MLIVLSLRSDEVGLTYSYLRWLGVVLPAFEDGRVIWAYWDPLRFVIRDMYRLNIYLCSLEDVYYIYVSINSIFVIP